MKTKKILAAIAALAIVCGAVPTQPFAEVIGNMAITASAETSEDYFEFEDGVILRYDGYATKVVIPSTIGGDTVTSIGESAFSFSSVTSITIPDSVTSIGRSAFSGCSSLREINIPDSVTSIGEAAFYGCSSLTEITIPDSVTSIGDSAFSGCSSLREINIPDSVASIGMSAFSGCEKLTSITAPCKVKWNESDWKAGCNANVTYTHLLHGSYRSFRKIMI